MKSPYLDDVSGDINIDIIIEQTTYNSKDNSRHCKYYVNYKTNQTHSFNVLDLRAYSEMRKRLKFDAQVIYGHIYVNVRRTENSELRVLVNIHTTHIHSHDDTCILFTQ